MDYHNENDPYAVEWLRNLITAGHLPPGDVDDRSIEDVTPNDLKGYEQCHFFAGIGGWPLALKLAGWEGPVWTGSCPCQPLSAAGKRQGEADARHLWPVWGHLIAKCHPPTVFGEQIAASLGREWFTGVRLDLEDMGYAVGAADLCAAGVGAPHIRQRLWFVGHSTRTPRQRQSVQQHQLSGAADRGSDGLAHTDGGESGDRGIQPSGKHGQQPEDGGTDIVADTKRGATERHGHEVAGAPSADQEGTEQRERIRDELVDGSISIPVADTNESGQRSASRRSSGGKTPETGNDIGWGGKDGPVADTQRPQRGPLDRPRRDEGWNSVSQWEEGPGGIGSRGEDVPLAHADSNGQGPQQGNPSEERGVQEAERQPEHGSPISGGSGSDGSVANTGHTDGRGEQQAERARSGRPGPTGSSRMVNSDSTGSQERRGDRGGQTEAPRSNTGQASEHPSQDSGLEHPESDGRIERGAESGGRGASGGRGYINCTDGKARRVEPGIFPLAHGVPNRVGRLRAYGNAIVPACAAEFIKAAM